MDRVDFATEARALEDYRVFAVTTIQRFWRGAAVRRRLAREMREATRAAAEAAAARAAAARAYGAARAIQDAWRARRNRAAFARLRGLLALASAADPRAVLRAVNPREAALLDAAAGAHVRFRLGGGSFPPAVMYKIYTHRPVADINAFAPRDYASEPPVDQEAASGTPPGPASNAAAGDRDSQLRPYTRPDGSVGYRCTRGWYRRNDRNGWRAIAAPAPPAPEKHQRQQLGRWRVGEPPAGDARGLAKRSRLARLARRRRASASAAAADGGDGAGEAAPPAPAQPVTHFSSLVRREERVRRRKRRRREWLVKLYRSGLAEAGGGSGGSGSVGSGGGGSHGLATVAEEAVDAAAGERAEQPQTAAAALQGAFLQQRAGAPSAYAAWSAEPLPAATEAEEALLAELELRLHVGKSKGGGGGSVEPAAEEGGGLDSALLLWASALDFDAYAAHWLASACTLASEAAAAALRDEASLLDRLAAAAPVGGGEAPARAGGGAGGGGEDGASACAAAAPGPLPVQA
ncbi:hypothetical protein Rsub_04490 [Raphidocelis subcapitata]|uniref:Uncharacterized protein n=1 Tax=Raphidocelis subcapitata TaxID=307507 RepID=A0A2V0P2R3_9CHLO|nr:hypothetical protein Rsub_04490 [Raphidocelis subcapitata]|eukprot:GBF92143.1 hypothetical protein Rsub_04490 [Raphidocelis subcapitata]